MTQNERIFCHALASCLEAAGWRRDPAGCNVWTTPETQEVGGLQVPALEVRPLTQRAVSLRPCVGRTTVVGSQTDEGPAAAAAEVAARLHEIRRRQQQEHEEVKAS